MFVYVILPNGWSDLLGSVETLKFCGVENPADIHENIPPMVVWKIKDYILGNLKQRDPDWDNYMPKVVMWAKKIGIKRTNEGVPLENFLKEYLTLKPLS